MSANARSSGGEGKKLSKDTDRLSNLPKSILYHILSLLPTKDAVATTLLSSKWKSHWTNVHNLIFSDIDHRPRRRGAKDRKVKFAHFVNRVLIFLNQQTIDKVVFEIVECCNLYDFTTWLTTGVARRLKVLEFSLINCDSYIQLPSCLFTCETLEVLVLRWVRCLEVPSRICLPNLKTLELESCNESLCELMYVCSRLEVLVLHSISISRIPSSFCLPNLKTLHLDKVTYQSDESVCKLISGCILLETLYIERDYCDNVVIFIISSLTLRNLTYTTGSFARNRGYKLEIKAPELKYLNLHNWLPRDLSVAHLWRLDEAIIETQSVKVEEKYQWCKAVVELYKGVSKVKHLTLCDNTIQALSHAGRPSLGYTGFLRLTRLTAKVECCTLNMVLRLVEPWGHLEFMDFDLNGKRETSWKDPVGVPVCLSLSLKTLVITGFRGPQEELAMVAYILKNAKLLRTVTIKASDTLDVTSRFQLLQKISEFPRISTCCQITFS